MDPFEQLEKMLRRLIWDDILFYFLDKFYADRSAKDPFQVVELAGYASRVYHMFKVFEDVKQQKFIRGRSLENVDENEMEQYDAHEIRGNCFS